MKRHIAAGIAGSIIYGFAYPIVRLVKFKSKSVNKVVKNKNGLIYSQLDCDIPWIKNLPLFKNLINGDMTLVGAYLYADYPKDMKAGIFSLYGLRQNSGINYDSPETLNEEYLLKKSLSYDLKLISKTIVSGALAKNSKSSEIKDNLQLFGVNFLNITMDNAVRIIRDNVEANSKIKIFFVNADTLNKAFSDSSFKNNLNSTPFVFPDGSGVKVATNAFNTPLKQNINGTDLFPKICKMAEESGKSIFLFGGQSGVPSEMRRKVLEQFPKLNIVGCLNGFDHSNTHVISEINKSKADIVLVALGAPLQESWITQYQNQIESPVLIGVGGLFDFYSERIARAPLWVRELGLEWVFRLKQEPRRMWQRYVLGNPLFLIRVFKQKHNLSFKSILKNVALFSIKSLFLIPIFIGQILLFNFHLGLKRVLDLLLSSFGLLLLSPLFFYLAYKIKSESSGAVFFKQRRVGKNGVEFNMYKFRSMVIDAESQKEALMSKNESSDGVLFKIKDDPRVTNIGKIIRKWSLDELPQLFNVLKGDMSLVGPRPHLANEVDSYSKDDYDRLNALPGLTCYWQISGRSDLSFEEQVKLDKLYIEQQSFFVDLYIIFMTIPAILEQRGAS